MNRTNDSGASAAGVAALGIVLLTACASTGGRSSGTEANASVAGNPAPSAKSVSRPQESGEATGAGDSGQLADESPAAGDSEVQEGPRLRKDLVEEVEGYPVGERLVGTPIDIETDLARGFPKKGSVFPSAIPKSYFTWKEKLYADHGVKLAFNATFVGQLFSDVLDQQWLTGAPTEDWAAGFGLTLEGKWEAINRGKDWQGGLTAAFDWRQGLGDGAIPTPGSLDNGSLWGTEFTMLEWDPWFPVVFWEQWGAKDRLVTRLGSQSAVQMFDFFRFKDGRSSFTNSEFWFPATSMPLPGPGFGGSFEWWPKKDSPLYVVGTVNDLNFTVGESFSWGSAFERADFFYGLEVGYNWGEFPKNFDHLHVQFFYADETSTQLPIFPNKAGGGVKVRGSKQWDRVVGFGSYTYNTAEGGPFGLTLAEHAATAGLAYQRPWDVRGEVALGANWAQPFSQFSNAAPVFQGLEDQYGFETYWKILLTPDLWFTPGVQLIIDPSFNPGVDMLTVGTAKLHFFI